MARTPNRVEWRAGRWVVEGRGGCPACRWEGEIKLEIPESFLVQMIEEGKRRRRGEERDRIEALERLQKPP